MKSLLLIAVCIGLTGCGGPYADLEKKFAVEKASSASAIPSKTLVLVSTKHRGAYNLRNAVDIRLLPDSVEIDPKLPMMETVRIPTSAMAGCSKTCFGPAKWDANIFIPDAAIEVSIENSQEVLEWCWDQRLPMISGKHRRDWLYSGGRLPPKRAYAEQLSSRGKYDEQTTLSCQGY